MKFFILFSSFTLLAFVQTSSADLNHAHPLKTIGYLKPVNRLNEFLSDFTCQVYQDYFKNQKRFTAYNLSHHRIPPSFDAMLHLSQRVQVHTLLRTEIEKTKETYKFTLEWIYPLEKSTLGTEIFHFPIPSQDA